MIMYPFQSQYSPRTILEQEGDKKFVFIDHPVYGQHRFSLPTKEEIYKDYSYFSEPSKKKCINSFMIFRTYLQKSKQNQNYLVLGEVSKIASVAWSFATQNVKDACDELEKKLKESFIHKRFIPYTHSPKKPKKNKSSSKKESSKDQGYYPSPNPSMISDQIYYPSQTSPMISRDQFYYPSPTSPMILSDLMYPDSSVISPTTPFDSSQMNMPPSSMISPLSLQITPFDPSQMDMPLLTLPSSMISPLSLQTTLFDPSQMNMSLLTLPPSYSEEITPTSSDQNQLFSLTPAQILKSSPTPHSLQFHEHFNIPLNETATGSLTGAQSTWSYLPEEDH